MKRKELQNVYMFDTRLENIVINEYLIFAPGDFVKVYLVALMYADMNKEISEEEIGKTVGIDVAKVKEAFSYWQKAGIVEKDDKGEIIFLNIRERMFEGDALDNDRESITVDQAKEHPLINVDLQQVFGEVEKISNKTMTLMHMERLKSFLDEFDIDGDLIIYAHKHAVAKGKNNVFDYANNVLNVWIEKGISSVFQAKEYMSERDAHYHIYKRVLNSLGFRRLATDGEMEIMDNWISKGISVEEMLKACKKTTGISNPNLNYVDAVLMSNLKEKTGADADGNVTRQRLQEYLEFLRYEAEEKARKRVEKVERDIPEIKRLADELRELNFGLVRATISGGNQTDEIKRKIADNKREMNMLLHRNDIPIDYMEVKYKCPICKDFGTLDDGRPCSCIPKREKEALDWNR